MFEVRYAFSLTTAQSVRTSRPDVVRTFATEAEARNDVAPAGAKMMLIRQLEPTFQFIARVKL